MLLQDAEQSASFDPYRVLISFGFASTTPLPFVGIGVLKFDEISRALHEFTHQDGMFSEMGLWYLHAFWKFIANINRAQSGLQLLMREHLWESYWLLAFLLEGQAMFAQLHLQPSPQLEASSLQHGFLQDLGIAYQRISAQDFSSMTSGIARLFRNATKTVHEQGLKYQLLTSSGSQDHYPLGYLFFRSIQTYLSDFDPRFRDPEVFFIFFTNFVFNNIFERLSGTELYDRPAGSFFHYLLSAVRRAGPQASALLEPITGFPHHTANYRLVDNIAFIETGEWRSRRSLDKAIVSLHDDIAAIDPDMAQFFLSSGLCLQFLHLKTADVHILGFTAEESPMMTMYCRDNAQGMIGGVRVSTESAQAVRQWVAKQGKALMTLPSLGVLRISDVMPGLAEFAQCEIHSIRPLLGGTSFTCMATEYDFLLLQQLSSIKNLTGADEALAARGMSMDDVNRMRHMHSRAHERIIDILANDSFVRSRECRDRLMRHYLGRLQQTEEQFHEHMKKRSKDDSWHDEHDPVAVRDRARETIRSLFHLAVWSHRSPHCNAPSPVSAALKEARLEKAFLAWCQETPFDAADRYRTPTCSRQLQSTLAPLFSGSFFVNDQVRIENVL